MIGQAFQVLTEFKFDVGSAIAGSEKVQKAVGGIATAAEGALASIEGLANGLVTKLGLAGGVFATLHKAVEISEEFRKSQMAFAGGLTINMKYLSGSVDTFNNRLRASQAIMTDMARVAQQFGFDGGSFTGAANGLAQTLMPHGRAGNNFGYATQMTQQAFLLAPMLGVTGQDAAKQAGQAISGFGDDGPNALFKALLSTKAMKGMTGDAFGDLGADKKITLLSNSMRELVRQTGAANFQLDSIGAQWQRLKSQFFDPVIGMFRRVGDQFRKYIVEGLKYINDYVEGPGKVIFNNLLASIQQFTKGGLEPMLVTLMQLSHLKTDFNKALMTLTVLTFISDLLMGFKMLKTIFPWMGGGLAKLFAPITKFINGITLRGVMSGMMEGGERIAFMIYRNFGTILTVIRYVFSMMRFAVMNFFLPFTILLAMFQGYSKAAARAKIEQNQNQMTEVFPELSRLWLRFTVAIQNVLHPFNVLVEGFAQLFGLFHSSRGKWTWLLPIINLLVRGFEILGSVMVRIFAAIYAFVGAIAHLSFLRQQQGIKGLFTGDFWKQIGTGMKDDFNEYLKNNLAQVEKGNATVNQTTNMNGPIHIHNDFKENAQPDRIAFTLKEQLLKAAQNPTQAKGRKFSNTR